MKQYIYLLLCCLWVSLSMRAASYSGTLPVLHIQTENNAAIVSKDDYVNATYYLDPMGQKGIQSIGSATAPAVITLGMDLIRSLIASNCLTNNHF